MAKKKEEKKQIVPLYNEESEYPFWSYKKYENDSAESVNNWIREFGPQIRQTFATNQFYDNISQVATQIGVRLHPLFKKPVVKQQSEFAEENPAPVNLEQENPSTLNFNCIKIDYCSLRLLDFVFQSSKITTLKFSNNNFTELELTALEMLVQNQLNKVQKIFFDWNSQEGNQQQFNNLLVAFGKSTSIDCLTLRANKLSTSQLQILCQAISDNQNCNLKTLDLYDNPLQKEAFLIFKNLFYANKSIDTLVLAKCQIQSLEDMSELIWQLGKFPMTSEEVDEYRVKEKEREAIIQKNIKQKQKKQPEDPVPILPVIMQNPDNSYSIVRNITLQSLNLQLNQIDENSKDLIEKIFQQTSENFQLDAKLKDRLRKKYNKRLMI